ncbi:PD-(D/E)XK nuclease family protein [Gracilimonas halophila]|uniref:PD-(D/E)XK nuclease family protein n=1 Tax=Gracilimonas halophila TaxID=1834464 RepID=A0ABW5JHY2_9BACT
MEFKIADVREKEIDFLLAEEFASSSTFASLFLRKFEAFKDSNFTVKKVYRSHTDSYGESDLEVYLTNDADQRLVLLIENKVAAQFQTNQLQRYKKRGETYLRQDKCDDYKIILVAPKEYSNDFESLEIDACVFYEDLRNWFKEGAVNSHRSKFKIALLKRAIHKAKHGYQLIEDEKASQFWINYWHLVNDVAPVLNMPRPNKKPSGSSFVYFYPPNLLSRLSLIHKFTYGNVDLQISKAANKTGIIRESMSEIITDRIYIQQAGKSAVIRKKVPVLDLNRSVESQSEKAKKCIQEVKSIYEWFLENKELFHHLFEKWA